MGSSQYYQKRRLEFEQYLVTAKQQAAAKLASFTAQDRSARFWKTSICAGRIPTIQNGLDASRPAWTNYFCFAAAGCAGN